MSDINKIVLDDDDPFPEIANIQRCFVETEKRVIDALKKGSLSSPKVDRSERFLRQHIGSKQKLVVYIC